MLDQTTAQPRHDWTWFRLDQVTGAMVVVLLLAAGAGYIYYQEQQSAARWAAVRASQAATASKLAELRERTRESLDRASKSIEQRRREQLRVLALEYRVRTQELGRPPRNWQELRPTARPQPTATSGRRTDEARFDFAWGLDVHPLTATQRASRLLVWEKQPNAEGRHWVLFADLEQAKELSTAELEMLRAK